MNFKLSDSIEKNLGSVSEMCDMEHLVIFSKNGGGIIKDPGEKLARMIMTRVEGSIPFRRDEKKGTYSLDMWVKKASIESKSEVSMRNAREEVGAKRQSVDESEMEVDELAAVSAQDWEVFVSRSQKRKDRKAVFPRRD